MALLFAATFIAAFFGDTTVAEAQFVTDGLVEGQIRSAMRFTGGERIQILSAEELVLKDYTVEYLGEKLTLTWGELKTSR